MKASTAVSLWNTWRKEGKEPKTRLDAFRIVSFNTDTPLNKLKNAYSLFERNDGTEKINDGLSMLVWDIQENGKRLFCYDKETGWFMSALASASNMIYSRTRINVQMGKGTLGIPTVVKMPGKGATFIAEMKPLELRNFSEAQMEEGRRMVKRWKFMGLNAPRMIQMLRQLEHEVAEEAGLYEPLPADMPELRI